VAGGRKSLAAMTCPFFHAKDRFTDRNSLLGLNFPDSAQLDASRRETICLGAAVEGKGPRRGVQSGAWREYEA